MILCDTHADTLHALDNRPAAARDVTAEGLRQGGVSLQTLALFKTQTVWHEIRHSGVRLASSELALRRGKIA